MTRTPLQSSLHPNNLVGLPNVKHRPQQTSGLIEQPYNSDSDNSTAISVEHRFKSYESTFQRSSESLIRDNLLLCKALVKAFNYGTHKDTKFHAERYATHSDIYNICCECLQPKRVKYAKEYGWKVIDKIPIGTYDKYTLGGQKLNHLVRTTRSPLASRFEYDFYKGEMYAFIQSHFVVEITNRVASYRYDDGTNRNIQLRYTKDKKRKSFFVEVHDDGTETPTIPYKHYIVRDRKCSCGKL